MAANTMVCATIHYLPPRDAAGLAAARHPDPLTLQSLSVAPSAVTDPVSACSARSRHDHEDFYAPWHVKVFVTASVFAIMVRTAHFRLTAAPADTGARLTKRH